MNLSKCKRCFTKLTQKMTHCPVCGTGDILDPDKSEGQTPQPDKRIDTPKEIIKLCNAFRERYFTVEFIRDDYFRRLRQASRREGMAFLSLNGDQLVDDAFVKIRDASSWEGYSNVATITDPARAALASYFSLNKENAEFAISHPIVNEQDWETEVADYNQAFIGKMKLNVIMAVDLLREAMRAYSVNDEMDEMAFSAFERYFTNGLALSLMLLEHNITIIVNQNMKVTNTLAYRIVIALKMLNATCEIILVDNVPEDMQGSYKMDLELAKYFHIQTDRFLEPALNGNFEDLIHNFPLWSAKAKSDVEFWNKKSEELYQVFGGFDDP